MLMLFQFMHICLLRKANVLLKAVQKAKKKSTTDVPDVV